VTAFDFFADAAFSSATDDWATPRRVFDELDREFGFTLDVCADAGNAKCARYFDCETDGLRQAWEGVCWMNPPYGARIGQWLEKARLEAEAGNATVVCLVRARTDTAWWHDHAMKGEVRFLRGRLRFGSAINSAPFPSAVVVFRAGPRPGDGTP
jgi:phage N-6-adenine-methyltransferase